MGVTWDLLSLTKWLNRTYVCGGPVTLVYEPEVRHLSLSYPYYIWQVMMLSLNTFTKSENVRCIDYQGAVKK